MKKTLLSLVAALLFTLTMPTEIQQTSVAISFIHNNDIVVAIVEDEVVL